MHTTDRDPLDPVFDWRLKAALDRISPPASSPRYADRAMASLRRWRIAPIVLAAGAACLLVLTAAFTTGSPNPVVWTQRAATTIESVRHAPETNPSPEPSKPAGATPRSVQAAPPPNSAQHASPLPRQSERPEASPRPERSESPDRSGDRFDWSPYRRSGFHLAPRTAGWTSDFLRDRRS